MEQRQGDVLTDLLAGHRWEELWRFICHEEDGYEWLLTTLHGNDTLLKAAVLKMLNEDAPQFLADLAERLAEKEAER